MSRNKPYLTVTFPCISSGWLLTSHSSSLLFWISPSSNNTRLQQKSLDPEFVFMNWRHLLQVLCSFRKARRVTVWPGQGAHERVHEGAEGSLSSPLTLEVNVLMLVHFPVHMWMCVRVNVRVDFGVGLGSQSASSLSQEQLLMSNVFLIGETVFISIGHLGGERRAGPFTSGHR